MAYKAQSAATVTANKKAKAARHQKMLDKHDSMDKLIKLQKKPHGITRMKRRQDHFEALQQVAETAAI